MPFGQLVIGPPGSGKTTYCCGMDQYLGELGLKRKVCAVLLTCALSLATSPYASPIRQTNGVAASGVQVAIVNLDPANDPSGYKPAVDIQVWPATRRGNTAGVRAP